MSKKIFGEIFLAGSLVTGMSAAVVVAEAPAAAAALHKTTVTTKHGGSHNNQIRSGINGKVQHTTTTTTMPVPVNGEGVVTNLCELMEQSPSIQPDLQTTMAIGKISSAKCLTKEPSTDTFNEGKLAAFARFVSPHYQRVDADQVIGKSWQKEHYGAEADIYTWNNYYTQETIGDVVQHPPETEADDLNFIGDIQCQDNYTDQEFSGNPGLVCMNGGSAYALISHNAQNYVLGYGSTVPKNISEQTQAADNVAITAVLAATAFR